MNSKAVKERVSQRVWLAADARIRGAAVAVAAFHDIECAVWRNTDNSDQIEARVRQEIP